MWSTAAGQNTIIVSQIFLDTDPVLYGDCPGLWGVPGSVFLSFCIVTRLHVPPESIWKQMKWSISTWHCFLNLPNGQDSWKYSCRLLQAVHKYTQNTTCRDNYYINGGMWTNAKPNDHSKDVTKNCIPFTEIIIRSSVKLTTEKSRSHRYTNVSYWRKPSAFKVHLWQTSSNQKCCYDLHINMQKKHPDSIQRKCVHEVNRRQLVQRQNKIHLKNVLYINILYF